ncbi:tRNA (adenosine(37)-N6)-threonylcarbamoyltransferase complex dimerization subunit type 1 TsaB [Natronospora cellulosivora (SeqCode)]
MLILGIDTSSSLGAIGLFDENGLVAEANIRLFHRHSEELISNIEFILKQSARSSKELSAIAVVSGPGSFTGLRIGLSTAKTFAQVLEIPLVSLSSLDVLAYNLNFSETYIVPLIDAKRERVYTSIYSKWDQDIQEQKLEKDTAIEVEKLIEKLLNLDSESTYNLVGGGAKKYGQYFEDSDLHINIASDSISVPRGGVIAELGYYYLNNAKAENYLQVNANYLKKPQAEINWLKKYGTGEGNGN